MGVVSQEATVLFPSSRGEAVELFGDDSEVTVFAGGTILMPEISYGRVKPGRTLMLSRAGLDQIASSDGGFAFEAMVPVSELEARAPEPLASAAHHVADVEVRAQATIGGNLCAEPGRDHPRGDLQVALLALAARIRSAGGRGERVDAIDDFLSGDERRLVLEIEVDRPARAGYAAQKRAHAGSYTVMSVACAETPAGTRVAAGGVAPRAVRLSSVEESLAAGSSPSEAAPRATVDVTPQDDALASSWYRERILPVLVERALNVMQRAP
jgi:CO/xanthine dehydrogenase FAD-binding subunit